MESGPQEIDKKDLRKKSFNVDALSEPNQDFFDEILESTHQSPTKTIDRICDLARKKVEQTAAAPERVMLPPNCGWAIFDDEFGDICIYGLKKPVRRAILPWRQLKYFRCDMCELLDLKRQEQKLLQEQLGKATLPILVNKYTVYEARRDIVLFAMKYETLSPSEIARHIQEDKGETRTSESIGMWFKRHPEETAEVKAYIDRRAAISPEERQKALIELQEKEKKRFVIQEIGDEAKEQT
ncbi:hypothetical protein MUP77_11980 [Candidatus Bathyarchaeota archaeon]|nr:hypothetical protein [Candidatus Bathyarchaeota archaeon]